jgi:trehalose synthase
VGDEKGSLTEVELHAHDPDRFRDVLTADGLRWFETGREAARGLMEGRVLWNVNSTARGGGVAEMLASLLAYAKGSGVDARWLVIAGDPEFFRVTKRIHNRLHESKGDGGPLGDDERRIYERRLAVAADELTARIGPRDVVLLHDPQTLGLAPRLAETGATVVWRCHIGVDHAGDLARETWTFLRRYLDAAEGSVFSRQAYVWDDLDPERVAIVAPSIDAFSPKNQDLGSETVRAILETTRVVASESDGGAPTFMLLDGTEHRVSRRTEMLEDEPIPDGAPVVLQVSRWDRLKDPLGVLAGFAEHVPADPEAHLVLAGPALGSVSDDPEGEEVLDESRTARESLAPEARRRVHLALVPAEDGDENAAIVNALQRWATVVVQKSLAEGFGLTVAEAMWKERPVVASRVGGIQDQIVHGESGLLIDDPTDLAAFGDAISSLLNDGERAATMGKAARERVREEFLGPRHLLQYVALFERLLK